MADGVDVGAAAVNQKMHAELGAGVAAAAEFVALEVGDDEVVGRHHAFADTGGRGKNAARIEAEGNVAVGGGDVGAVVNPAADGADIATVFVFGLQRAWRNGFRIQNVPPAVTQPFTGECGTDIWAATTKP